MFFLDNPVTSASFDLLGEVIQIVREAIEAGLITSETVEEFDDTVKELNGPDLEDYLQHLWDIM